MTMVSFHFPPLRNSFSCACKEKVSISWKYLQIESLPLPFLLRVLLDITFRTSTFLFRSIRPSTTPDISEPSTRAYFLPEYERLLYPNTPGTKDEAAAATETLSSGKRSAEKVTGR